MYIYHVTINSKTSIYNIFMFDLFNFAIIIKSTSKIIIWILTVLSIAKTLVLIQIIHK